jgi:hypothetical protein
MATKKSAVNDDLLTSEIMKLVSPETGTHDRQVTLHTCIRIFRRQCRQCDSVEVN